MNLAVTVAVVKKFLKRCEQSNQKGHSNHYTEEKASLPQSTRILCKFVQPLEFSVEFFCRYDLEISNFLDLFKDKSSVCRHFCTVLGLHGHKLDA
jgi:hypothetical protein